MHGPAVVIPTYNESENIVRLAREILVVLPDELTSDARIALARDYARTVTEHTGALVDLTVHAPREQGDERNHHAHLLLSARRLTADGFGERIALAQHWPELKAAGLPAVPKQIEEMKALWIEHGNAALAAAGLEARLSDRRVDELGIRIPTKPGWSRAVEARLRNGEESGVVERELRRADRQHLAGADGDAHRDAGRELRVRGLVGRVQRRGDDLRGEVERTRDQGAAGVAGAEEFLLVHLLRGGVMADENHLHVLVGTVQEVVEQHEEPLGDVLALFVHRRRYVHQAEHHRLRAGLRPLHAVAVAQVERVEERDMLQAFLQRGDLRAQPRRFRGGRGRRELGFELGTHRLVEVGPLEPGEAELQDAHRERITGERRVDQAVVVTMLAQKLGEGWKQAVVVDNKIIIIKSFVINLLEQVLLV